MKLFILLLISMLSSAALHAQSVYKWVDENGKVNYSTVLPPEVANARSHQRLTSEGLVAERYERVRTDEELADLEARRQAEAEEEAQREIEQQKDRLFLAAFPSENDIQRAFSGRRESLLTERRAMSSLREKNRERFGNLVEQAAAFERRGDPVPEFLVEQIEQQRFTIQQANERIAASDQRLESLEEELEDQLARFRRLTHSSG